MIKRSFSIFVFALIASTGVFVLSHCGSDSGGSGLNDVSLSSVPSASTMLQGTGANAITRLSFSNIAAGLNLQTVSGTPPKLIDLNSSNSDTYFWNGLVSTINTAGTCSATNKNKFWGQDTSTPGPGGRGACMMGQGVGEALSRMMDGTSTLCYMKKIPVAASGVTLSSGTAADVFKQTAGNKLVKVAVTNMSSENRNSRQSMDVYFLIYGSDTVGSLYKYQMHMCSSGTVTSKEILILNKEDGTLSIDSNQTESGGSRGSMSISAFLKNENGAIKFDPTKERTAISKFTGSWGTYAGKVVVSNGDLIKSWRYGYNSTWGTNKTYAVAAFSGTGVDDFRFLQGCFKGTSAPANNSTNWTYSGITEYRDSFYAAVASSDLSPQCDAFAFASDAFMADLTIPTSDYSDLNCSATPDITITMDFSDASVLAIKTECDGERRKLQNYSMCDSTAARTAENYCRN